MQMSRKSRVVLASFVALLASSSAALASHKSWYLRNPGTSCQPAQGMSFDSLTYMQGAIYNSGSSTRTVHCPVTLAGRFGGTGPGGTFTMAEWAAVMFGRVYVEDNSSSSNISCYAWARGTTGATYLSSSKTSLNTGNQTIKVYNESTRTWGSSLGTGNFSVRALGYTCTLPAFSMISGYAVKSCQNTVPCIP